MIPVLSAHMPFNIFGMNWLIISEIDEKEAIKAVDALRKWMVFIGISSAGFLAALTKLIVNRSIRISRFFKTLWMTLH